MHEDLNKQLNLNYKSDDEIDWLYISEYLLLSDEFIEKYKDKVDWANISVYQHLSETFIEKFKDKVNWFYISMYQHLSETFIEKFQDRVDWDYISRNQKLSEGFIKNFQDYVDWYNISKYQKLSESFIEKFQDKIYWYYISMYQKLSDKFIKDNNIDIYEDNWLYKDTDFKKKQIIYSGLYECHDDYFIGYKAIRDDRYSLFNFQYKYEPGNVYESTCDCTNEENSFGLNVGTRDYAKWYASKNSIIVKCKVRYEDVGRIVHKGGKVRCFRIEILN